MKTYNSTIKLTFEVGAKCENCGHEYNYKHPINVERGKIGSGYSTAKSASEAVNTAADRLIERYNDILNRGNFTDREWTLGKIRFERDIVGVPVPTIETHYGLGDIPCPQCGYLQSWQIRVHQARISRKWGRVIATIIGLAAIMLLVATQIGFANVPDMWTLVIVVIVFAGGFLVYISSIIWVILTQIIFRLVTRKIRPNKTFNEPQKFYKPKVEVVQQ